jgi:hypothetical protein
VVNDDDLSTSIEDITMKDEGDIDVAFIHRSNLSMMSS